MLETNSAVVAGHICLDIVPSLAESAQQKYEDMFLPGSLMQIGPVTFSTGGPVSNTGLALHKLGINTRLMGKVGDDLFGQSIRQIVASYAPHLADGMVVDGSVNSSYTIVITPPDVDRFFLHYPGANDTFSADDVRYDLLPEADLFHFGYPPIMRLMYEDGGVQLTDLLGRAKETGITTSVDMAVPDPPSAAGRADWMAILTSALPYVDIFMPSIEEILYMVRRQTYDDLASKARGSGFLALVTPELLSDVSGQLLDMGGKIVGLKMGERGLYVRTADEATLETMGRARPSDMTAWAEKEMWSSCFQVEFVGAAGSGDATIAGFLSALLRDMSPSEAVTAGVAVGACNVEAADTLSGLRSWEETMGRVAGGWARHDLGLASPGWEFDEAQQLWQRVGG